MAPDARRQSIVDVLIPLILERRGDVSTRDIAQAAGIAEGTIFRVFPDKRSLMLAAAEEIINPADGQAEFEAAVAGVGSLREKVVIVAGRVLERMQLTMSAMVALRPHLADSQEKDKPGPPPLFLKAQSDLNARLVGLFEPHTAELAVDAEVAALALRSLIFGSAHPVLGTGPGLSPDEIADLLFHGIATKER